MSLRPDALDPYELAKSAAAVVADRTGRDRHDVAVILGSGWRSAADILTGVDDFVDVPVAEIPGFIPPTAQGHGGTLRSLEIDGTRVLIILGRTHHYEGHPAGSVVHAVRTAAATGVASVFLTNAAGGLREGMQVGDPVILSDHLNLAGGSPLVGARFVNLVGAYDPELRRLIAAIDPSLTEGVYAMMAGPQYETPAEISMLRTLGADLVGMSTVWEVIAAREALVRVAAISLVTNLAAGITGAPLDHHEVLAAGQAAAQRMGTLLRDVVTSPEARRYDAARAAAPATDAPDAGAPETGAPETGAAATGTRP